MTSIISKITPGNYWLTKSMEFNKVQKSGTLWYLKKWIVFYYYVFLNEKIYDADYKEIIKIFENFIITLPEKLQENARNYFFEIDIRSNNFLKYADFIDKQNFKTKNEEEQFKIEAKRYYFMYLTVSGGQSGWKKKIKEKLNSKKGYSVIKSEITREMQKDKKTDAQIREQLSDFPAPIRNERQIYFYFGFFHGKDASNLTGFYNLTPIGKAILKSNFHELTLIWEHQKIKMISQSPVSDIQNLKPTYNSKYFAVNYHPYFDFLKTLNIRNKISLEEYQFAFSKSKTNLSVEEIIKELDKNSISIFKNKAKSFNRSAEIKHEDFAKELKKYLLGISDLPKDKKQNPYGFLNYIANSKIDIKTKNKFDFTYKFYSTLIKYLDKIYLELYENFEKELKQKYNSKIKNNSYKLNNSVKYEWAKYIINFDETIFLHLIYWSISLINNKFDYSLSKQEIADNYLNYSNLLELFGISKKEFTTFILSVQQELSKNNIIQFKDDYKFDDIFVKPAKITKTVKFEQLEKVSASTNGEIFLATKRKRNSQLIDLLRSYYFTEFKDTKTKLIKCDSCGSETFVTYNDYPYLEFHHIIPFSTEFGPDHYLNLLGICPNCHRKLHFAKTDLKTKLYRDISYNNNLKIELTKRIDKLFKIKLLEPIHFDFLLKENIINDEVYNKYMNTNITAA